MQRRTLLVKNRLGLHARAAAKIVRLSNQFKSELILQRCDNGRRGDAKSLLSILALAATQGTALVLTASGEDEDLAIRQVIHLIEHQLQEDDEREREP